MTRNEATEKAQKMVSQATEKDKKRIETVIRNWATILSLSVILLSIFQYMYKYGICKVFQLPNNVISIKLTDYILVVFFLCSIAFLLFYYFASIKTDIISKKVHFNPLRVFWGFLILYNFFLAYNTISKWNKITAIVYGIVAVVVFLIIELLLTRRGRKKRNAETNNKDYELRMRDYLEDRLFYEYFIKTGIILIVLIVITLPYISKMVTEHNLEYEICSYEEKNYAVIFEYTDRVLVEPVIIEDETLTISTDYFKYISKDAPVEFRVHEFEQVTIASKMD